MDDLPVSATHSKLPIRQNDLVSAFSVSRRSTQIRFSA
jgi:hypothetical protein